MPSLNHEILYEIFIECINIYTNYPKYNKDLVKFMLSGKKPYQMGYKHYQTCTKSVMCEYKEIYVDTQIPSSKTDIHKRLKFKSPLFKIIFPILCGATFDELYFWTKPSYDFKYDIEKLLKRANFPKLHYDWVSSGFQKCLEILMNKENIKSIWFNSFTELNVIPLTCPELRINMLGFKEFMEGKPEQ